MQFLTNDALTHAIVGRQLILPLSLKSVCTAAKGMMRAPSPTTQPAIATVQASYMYGYGPSPVSSLAPAACVTPSVTVQTVTQNFGNSGAAKPAPPITLAPEQKTVAHADIHHDRVTGSRFPAENTSPNSLLASVARAVFYSLAIVGIALYIMSFPS